MSVIIQFLQNFANTKFGSFHFVRKYSCLKRIHCILKKWFYSFSNIFYNTHVNINVVG